MEPQILRDQFIAVLEKIQADSGQPATPINGSTCPLTDLPGFDSKILPVAVVLLGEAIGVMIPADKNIFTTIKRDNLTVEQITEKVCGLITPQATVA